VEHPETRRLIKRLALIDGDQFSLARGTLENGGYLPGDITLEIFGNLKDVSSSVTMAESTGLYMILVSTWWNSRI